MGRKGKKIVRETKNFEKFERVGDAVEGQIVRDFVSNTKYGEQACIEIMDMETGELISVGLGSNLFFYKEDGHLEVGANVRIEYVGMEKNPSTGNKYKTFDVYDLDAEDDETTDTPG